MRSCTRRFSRWAAKLCGFVLSPSGRCHAKWSHSILCAAGLLVAVVGPTVAHASPRCVPGEYLAVVRDPLALNGRASALRSSDQLLTTFGRATVVREFGHLRRHQRRVLHVRMDQTLNLEGLTSHKDITVLPNCLNFAEGNEAFAEEAGTAQIELSPMSLEAQSLPSEGYEASLWALENTGQEGGLVNVDLDAPEAWQITKGDPSLVVAVLDSGIDYYHPELADSMWQNAAEIPDNGVDDDANGIVDDVFGADFIDNDGDPRPAPIFEPITPIMIARGHGTHVAGTIAAAENGLGIIGAAPQVRMMAVRVLGPDGSGTDAQILAGMEYVLAMRRRGVNIRVLNMSLGGEQPCSLAYAQTISALGEAGVLVVAASGNGGLDRVGDNIDRLPVNPASCPNETLLTVANVTRFGSLAVSSNSGQKSVDVAAPGTNILSAFPPQHLVDLSGTSMATPHVSGVAALLLSEEPELSPASARLRIMETVKPLQGLSGRLQTPGVVSAYRAVNAQRAYDLSVSFKRLQGTATSDGSSVLLDLSVKLADPSRRVVRGLVEVTNGSSMYYGTLRKRSHARGVTTLVAKGRGSYRGGKLSLRYFAELSDGSMIVSGRREQRVKGDRTGQKRAMVNFAGVWKGRFQLASTSCQSAGPGFPFAHRVSQTGTRVTLKEQGTGGLTFLGALHERGFSASARSSREGCELSATMHYANPRSNLSNVSAVVHLDCGARGACRAEYRGKGER